jgi:hypothetical protein
MRGFLPLHWHPRVRAGARALPLCGAALTFFAAAKKATVLKVKCLGLSRS